METIEQVTARIAELDRTARGRKFTDAEREEWHRLNARVDENEQEIRRARLRELATRRQHRAASRRLRLRPRARAGDRCGALAGAGDRGAVYPIRHAHEHRGRPPRRARPAG